MVFFYLLNAFAIVATDNQKELAKALVYLHKLEENKIVYSSQRIFEEKRSAIRDRIKLLRDVMPQDQVENVMAQFNIQQGMKELKEAYSRLLKNNQNQSTHLSTQEKS